MQAITNLDIDLLRAFATIAESASFTRAAERLHRTQSTISLQVKRLEEQIGRQLFERNARMVRLTAEGEVLLAYALRILQVNDEAVSRLTEPDLEGSVRLGTPEDFATTHLPRVLARFARSNPRVALEVSCDLTLNLLAGYECGEFDLVLLKREPEGPSTGVMVWREPLVWAALDRGIVQVDRPLPLILSPQPCVYRRRAVEALGEARKDWRIAYTSPSLAGTQAAVFAGLGVTVLPKEMVPAGLHVLGAQDGLPDLHDTEIALFGRSEGQSKPAQRLAEHIIRSLEQMTADRQGTAGGARRAA